MGKCKRQSCMFCLWNWVAPIGLPPKTCYNVKSPKYHRRALGGCAEFEPPVAESHDFNAYRYPNGKPPKEKKKKKVPFTDEQT